MFVQSGIHPPVVAARKMFKTLPLCSRTDDIKCCRERVKRSLNLFFFFYKCCNFQLLMFD